MVLGAHTIRKLLSENTIVFDGELRGDALQLTAGGPVLRFRADPGPRVDIAREGDVARLYESVANNWNELVLAPKELVLTQVRERIELKGRAVGVIGTLSHVARVGLMAHLASPFVAPNFAGHVTLELFNAGPAELLIRPGMALAKIVLFDIDGHDAESRSPMYGKLGELRSVYAQEFSSGTADDV